MLCTTPSQNTAMQLTCQSICLQDMCQFLQDLYLSPNSGTSNVPTLQLGLAFGASVYYLRELKRLPLGRALSIAARNTHSPCRPALKMVHSPSGQLTNTSTPWLLATILMLSAIHLEAVYPCSKTSIPSGIGKSGKKSLKEISDPLSVSSMLLLSDVVDASGLSFQHDQDDSVLQTDSIAKYLLDGLLMHWIGSDNMIRMYLQIFVTHSGHNFQACLSCAARAGLLTTAGLLAGTLLGSALQSWLRIDIVPIGVRCPSNKQHP